MLFSDALFLQTIGVKCTFTMVAYNKVFVPIFNTSLRHFFNRYCAIAPITMTVNNAFNIAGLYNSRYFF